MDSPDSVDEVIADSEGEMDEDVDPGTRGTFPDNSKEVASQVSMFTLTGQLRGTTTSSISTFTAGPAAFCQQSTIADNTDDTSNQLPDVTNFVGTSSIADRAKTRQRNSKSSPQSSSTNATTSSNGRLENAKSLSSDIIELTSDEDDHELSLQSSKLKSKPKLKVKDKPRNTSNDKNFSVSGSTEVSPDKRDDAVPDSRPRPRPRPLVKRNKTAHESIVPQPPLSLDAPGLLPSSSASASHGPELPIATSPAQPHLHNFQLPPSDPPLPTLTTTYDEEALPRIETLPNSDFDGPLSPLSSPSSLFSEPGSRTKKRKRTVFDPDIDELASDYDLGNGQASIGPGADHDCDNGIAAHIPPHMLPPPPTFFAGSSSSSIGAGDRKISPQVPSERASEVVDLTMLPATIEPAGMTATRKAAKGKKSHQKKDGLTILNEDELDDDFDSTESNKRGKAKPKTKGKKGAVTKARRREGHRQVEVTIVSKPRTQKQKGKAAENKDNFKSREFIDDSGDERDSIQLIPAANDPATSDANHNTSTNRKGAHILTFTGSKTTKSSVLASQVGPTSTPPSKNLLKENRPFSGNKFNPEVIMSSSSSNQMTKKRKSISKSDLEDEDEGETDQPVAVKNPKKHKGKHRKSNSNADEEAHSTIYVNPPTGSKKGKKGKNVVWSDEDDEEIDLDPSIRLPKGKKPATMLEDDGEAGRSTKKGTAKLKRSGTKSKVVANDDDVYVDDLEEIQEQEPAPEAGVTKENVIPPLKSAASTSKPDDRLKVESPGLFPSLHSRYEIAPRRNSLPMSELIRRANSTPGSPFATPHPRASSSSTARPIKPGMGVTAYSPYLKSSRSILSRIAPLHPNRRTPPPTPPPPPPKKKTKKELEMEEKWEEEMIDSVGGTSEWACLADAEKKELRRAKWAREMGDWDD